MDVPSIELDADSEELEDGIDLRRHLHLRAERLPHLEQPAPLRFARLRHRKRAIVHQDARDEGEDDGDAQGRNDCQVAGARPALAAFTVVRVEVMASTGLTKDAKRPLKAGLAACCVWAAANAARALVRTMVLTALDVD
eukprot:scaffold104115_cov67-Phaeocystis_antarctica.AAC.8